MGMVLQEREVVLRHGHMACGIGAGAKGFNLASPRVGNLKARFECAGGIDVDAGAIANFEKMTGVPGTVMDLFDRAQYATWHGKEPPFGWTEATPEDIRRVFGKLDILFASYPCKGFSGLLSNAQSGTDKYQALNNLTLRGMWLSLEAYKDDPIPIILFENVPRIATRGRWLLDQICVLLRHYGYHVAESVHDCGEIGNLAQSRKRFLLVARHPDKVPDFMYEPVKHPLRGVGEVIGLLPLPGDPAGGPMHRVPSLQWRTWVRLAFVEAGKDWRSLNRLEVENGVLKDYGIVRQDALRDNAYGVCRWDDTGPVVTAARAPGQGRFSVADIRVGSTREGTGFLGVRDWMQSSALIAGASRQSNGPYSVADPRPGYGAQTHHTVLGVAKWGSYRGTVTSGRVTSGANAVADPRCTWGENSHRNKLRVVTMSGKAPTVTGADRVGSGAASVADPRVDGHFKSVQLGVKRWKQTVGVVKGKMDAGQGPYSVADPRLAGKPRFNNTFKIVRFYERGVESATGVGGHIPSQQPGQSTEPGQAGQVQGRHENHQGTGAGGERAELPFGDALGCGDQQDAAISGAPSGAAHVQGAMPAGERGAPPQRETAGQSDHQSDVVDAQGEHRGQGKARDAGSRHAAMEGDTAALAGDRDQGVTHAIDGDRTPLSSVSERDPRYPSAAQMEAYRVIDPRPAPSDYSSRKYKVHPYNGTSRAVIGASTTGDGAFALADPKPGYGMSTHQNILYVVSYGATAKSVIGARHVAGGAMSVADPRPVCLTNPARVSYMTQGHYGVQAWQGSSGSIPGHPKDNNGPWSIADERHGLISAAAFAAESDRLPEPGDRLVARIIAEDGTWHRPFTTLELAALQSLFDPREAFDLTATSDATRREWIGNAVPSVAAKGMAETVGEALLRARLGITFSLSARSVWVSPLDLALAVRTDQPALAMDAGLI